MDNTTLFKVNSKGQRYGSLVLATCDRNTCTNVIRRDESSQCPSCDLYFCRNDAGTITLNKKTGSWKCNHRQIKSYGVVVNCMERNPTGTMICMEQGSHAGPHVWNLLPTYE